MIGFQKEKKMCMGVGACKKCVHSVRKREKEGDVETRERIMPSW
jgi:hypothetical protein